MVSIFCGLKLRGTWGPREMRGEGPEPGASLRFRGRRVFRGAGAPIHTNVAEGDSLEAHSETVVWIGVVPRVGIAYILVPLRGPARSCFAIFATSALRALSLICSGEPIFGYVVPRVGIAYILVPLRGPARSRFAIFATSALRALSLLCSGEPIFGYVVPRVGIEPTLPKEQDFKSCVYTSFTTAARNLNKPDYFRQFVFIRQGYLNINV